MTDIPIPADIMQSAIVAFNTAADSNDWDSGEPYEIIARALLAERKRCADIAFDAMFNEVDAFKARRLSNAIMKGEPDERL